MKKNVKSVPEIRFPGFTDLWEERKLGNTVQITMGQSPNGGTYSDVPSDYILVQGNADLRNGWVFPRVWTSQMTKQADAGDLIMSVRAPAGAMGKTAYNVVIGRGVAAIKGNEFMYQLLVKMDSGGYWKTLSCGSTFESLNSNNIKNADVFIPDIAEQEKIGKYFCNLDNLITFQETQCKVLKDFKQCMLQKMFPKDGSDKPEIRFPGFTGSWEQRKLLDYADFYSGNGLSWNDISDDGQEECILYGNLYTEYGMIADKIVYRTNSTIKNPVYSKFGDVLIPASDTTPTGLARATSIEKSGVLLGGDINIVRPKDKINGSCLSLAINANKKELIKFIKGTSVRHIHNADIKTIEIPMPQNNAEQEKLVNYFKNLDNLITLQERKCKVLRELKKCMLQKMFV